MNHIFRFRSGIGVGLVLLLLFMTGCASSPHTWTVRTSSTPFPPSSDPASVGQEAVALFTPLATPPIRGNEAGLGLYLDGAIKKVAPTWKIIDEQQTINLINRHGLAGEYARLREVAEQSHILDRGLLQKIGKNIGARYVFQPRLAYISQTMTDRWKIPLVDVRISQTRSAHMRLSLQLWDTVSGELIWFSAAETALQSEAVTQDPVFIEDAARITLGSMLADLMNRQTSSRYTGINQFLNSLSRDKNGSESGGKPDQGQTKGTGGRIVPTNNKDY